jgi:type I pantothenate kinase
VTFEIVERAEWVTRGDPALRLPDWPDRPDRPDQSGGLDAAELREVYAPLAALVAERATGDGRAASGPYLVWISGSVAVGKSTAARALVALLEAHDAVGPGRVAHVATDGFLFPNRVLEARGIMERKGFPESFDRPRLQAFLAALRAGDAEVRAPVYSHECYDVTDDELVVRDATVVVLEGLPVVDDPVDLGLYLDAAEVDIESWYVERFLALRAEAVADEGSFFRTFAGIDQHDAAAIARAVWTQINVVNLREHILPARDRAHVVFEKGPDHAVRRVLVRG